MWAAVDTETTGLSIWHGARPFMLQLCDERGKLKVWQWSVNPTTRAVQYDESLAEALDVLSGYKTLVFHHAKFDLRMLSAAAGDANISFDLESLWPKIHDTMLAAHVMDSLESHRLNALAEKYFLIPTDDEKHLKQTVIKARRIGKRLKWNLAKTVAADYWLPYTLAEREQAPLRYENEWSTVCETYGVMDVKYRTANLWKMYRELLSANPQREKCYERERALLPLVYKMESAGLSLKPTCLIKAMRSRQEAVRQGQRDLQELAGNDFNPRSHQQKGEYLERAGVCVIRTEKGAIKTDSTTLTYYRENCNDNHRATAFITACQKFARNQTALGYLQNYRERAVRESENGRLVLHPSLNQVGSDERNVRTTRFSSSEPNMQNVAKDKGGEGNINLRAVFGPVRGYSWFAADYSQLELRILAVVANEQRMLQAFAAGEDIHQVTADACGIHRNQAKNVNFAIVYGASKAKLQEMSGRPDIGQVFRDAYPGAARWTRETTKAVQENGFVETLFGYRLFVPEDRPYAGVDYIIQGTAGDICKNAMIRCGKVLEKADFPGKLLLQVHDELIFEFPHPDTLKERDKLLTVLKQLKNEMQGAGEDLEICTPVEFSEIRESWDKAKPLGI